MNDLISATLREDHPGELTVNTKQGCTRSEVLATSLMMEAVSASETLVNFCETTQGPISQKAFV
jgi:hypothetical protein